MNDNMNESLLTPVVDLEWSLEDDAIVAFNTPQDPNCKSSCWCFVTPGG